MKKQLKISKKAENLVESLIDDSKNVALEEECGFDAKKLKKSIDCFEESKTKLYKYITKLEEERKASNSKHNLAVNQYHMIRAGLKL